MHRLLPLRLWRPVQLALFVALVVFVLLTQIAATGTATALAIASVVGAIAPFILKAVNLDGRWMLLVTAVVSIVIGIIAELVSGDVKLSNLSGLDPTRLYEAIAACFAVAQFVFAYFKDHPLGPFKVT